MRKMLVAGAMFVLCAVLVVRLRARSLQNGTASTSQNSADWRGTKVFLAESNGFVTTVRGLTPVGTPTLLWCDPEAVKRPN
jgi:hypothetical protein